METSLSTGNTLSLGTDNSVDLILYGDKGQPLDDYWRASVNVKLM